MIFRKYQLSISTNGTLANISYLALRSVYISILFKIGRHIPTKRVLCILSVEQDEKIDDGFRLKLNEKYSSTMKRKKGRKKS